MMKKIAFAAIGAGLAGSALAADTSVTLYGLLDMGLGARARLQPESHRHRAGREQRLAFRPARFRGPGDGLRAIFTLEGGITPLNGKSAQSGRLFGRQATVGLSDDSWGNLIRPPGQPGVQVFQRSDRSVQWLVQPGQHGHHAQRDEHPAL